MRPLVASAATAFWLFAGLVAGQTTAATAELQPATVQAFDSYIRAAEAAMQPHSAFLWVDQDPERVKQVRAGQVLSQPWAKRAETSVPSGLIHDWMGAAFIPGVTLDRTLAMVQDYDRHAKIYPEVIASKLLSRNGGDFKVYLRLLKKKVLTVVLNTQHDVRYTRVSPQRVSSRSYSTRITEVENAGKPGERELPPGRDHGFLWRLYSYWRFEERDGGVYIECRAISLTRSVPTGLGWLVEPIIRNLPRESLAGTLTATRGSLAK
ncbi:MAG TPA: hypothetical protein VN442_02315 [Bryobacteraceae bacterium]|nr:hypothetical protein [Bryobacteraceae bacterium]